MKHSYEISNKTDNVYIIGYIKPVSWYANTTRSNVNKLIYSVI